MRTRSRPSVEPTLQKLRAMEGYGMPYPSAKEKRYASAYRTGLHQGFAGAGARDLARRRTHQGRHHPRGIAPWGAGHRLIVRYAARPDTPRRDDLCLAYHWRPRRAILHHPAYHGRTGAAAHHDAALG